MSASSLLEQVQARPACLGHCVRRERARLGPGPPPPAAPRRRLSPAGFRASGRPRPAPRPRPALPASPGPGRPLAAPRSLLSGPRLPSWSPSPNPRPPRVARPPRFLRRPPASRAFLPPVFRLPLRTLPGASLQACSFIPLLGPGFHWSFLFHFFLGPLAARRRFLRPQRPKGQGNKGEPSSARGPGPGGGPAGGGGVSGRRPWAKACRKLLRSQVPRTAGSDPCGACLQLANSFLANKE